MTNKINEIVEKQIATWQWHRRVAAEKDSIQTQAPPPNVVTLSNERGAAGHKVAAELGKALNMPVYDREIVEHIATNKHVRISTVETLDQRALGRIDDYLLDLFRDHAFDQNDYAQALVHTLLLLWHHGPCILVGRGAVHVIPRENALAVRVVGNRSERVRRVRNLEKVDLQEAARIVDTADHERNAFSQHYFGVDINAPDTYDVVLNTSFVSVKEAAALAANLYRMKFKVRSPEAIAIDNAVA